MPDHKEVVIIGSGPAGLTAAIYTARANLNPLVIEGEPSSTSDQPGGQLMLTTDVENYPGFPTGIMGPELMSNFRSQAERFGAELLTKKVTHVNLLSNPFEVWVGDPSANPDFTADSVIVSTGAKALMLNLPNEIALVGHGISTCATCDGFFFRDQEIAVIGGGDSAVEEAMFLSRFASKVTIVHRRDQLRASKIMQDRAFSNPKIEFLWNHEVAEYIGDTKLEGLRVQNVIHQSQSILEVSGVFIAIDAVKIDLERISRAIKNHSTHVPLTCRDNRGVHAGNSLSSAVPANRCERKIGSANINPNIQRFGS